MRPAVALLPLMFLLLFVATVDSRKDSGEYWKMVVKDQNLSEEIQGLLNINSEIQSEKNLKTTHEHSGKGFKKKCEEPIATHTQLVTIEKKVLVDDDDIDAKERKKVFGDFEPRPNALAYGDNDIDAKEKKVVKNFEPRPNVSAYGKDDCNDKKKFVEDFEPRPNVSAYDGDDANKNKKFVEDFEPRPNISAYDGDDANENKKIVKDFEPRPNVSAYDGDDANENKNFVKDFEPRPNVSAYDD